MKPAVIKHHPGRMFFRTKLPEQMGILFDDPGAIPVQNSVSQADTGEIILEFLWKS
jgi:hypothetical protein